MSPFYIQSTKHKNYMQTSTNLSLQVGGRFFMVKFDLYKIYLFNNNKKEEEKITRFLVHDDKLTQRVETMKSLNMINLHTQKMEKYFQSLELIPICLRCYCSLDFMVYINAQNNFKIFYFLPIDTKAVIFHNICTNLYICPRNKVTYHSIFPGNYTFFSDTIKSHHS